MPRKIGSEHLLPSFVVSIPFLSEMTREKKLLVIDTDPGVGTALLTPSHIPASKPEPQRH